MTDMRERRVVQCPNRKASHYLAALVAGHQAGDGSVRSALRRPISRCAHRRPPIERPVVATLTVQSTSDPYLTYSATWLPKGDGLSPKFAALAVEKCPQNDRSGLILSGHEKPFSAVGARSDATSAGRIARSVRDEARHAGRLICP
jgi:hypothetical protein